MRPKPKEDMMKVKIEGFEIYPAGVYPVTVREITLDADNQYGAQFRFKFEMGAALSGKTLTGWCHQSGSVKSKFFEWYGALTSSTPKAGDEVDTDLLIGRQALAVIKVKNKEDGTQKNVIDSLLPFNGSNGATQQAQPAARPTLTYAQAVQECAALGIVEGELKLRLKTYLKENNLKGYSSTRDSQAVYDLIDWKQAQELEAEVEL